MPRHQARVIKLLYCGEGPIQQTLMVVGKVGFRLLYLDTRDRSVYSTYEHWMLWQGITYDTGGADIKAGGIMAGMHRDKCGSAAVAGFFQVPITYAPALFTDENIGVGYQYFLLLLFF